VKRCYIGLGANLGHSFHTLCRAAEALENLESSTAAGRSGIYRSAPIGPAGQPDYLNAVLALDTQLPPLLLLDQLQAIEHAEGRQRGERWGPRTLDLDLLLYEGCELNSERLTVPHPRLYERNFVLQPLADLLAPDWQFADGTSLQERLNQCPDNPLERMALPWQHFSALAGASAG
jgi:2-amino-4-hydroxy-6-hydroxymethyldihydropteridine diphosphokinase